MPGDFISPNWHVIFLHYPIALLTLGLLIELLSFLWPRGGFRVAGRWMILLGALLTIPTATSGIYAFRDALIPALGDPVLMPWHQVAEQSRWTEQQWEFMSRHAWYNAIGTALVLVAVVAWTASGDRLRRKLYLPALGLLIVGVAMFTLGAWHGGEAVYRYGTAVQEGPHVRATEAPPGSAAEAPRAFDDFNAWVRHYLPPLQMHIVLAGFVVASCVGALALTLRKAESPRPGPEEPPAVNPYDPLALDPAADRREVVDESHGPYGDERQTLLVPPKVYPGRFWLLAFVLAALTAVFGFWSVMGAWTAEAWEHNLEEVREEDHLRLLIHVILGVGIIALPLVLAALVRFARNWRVISLALAALLFVVIGFQTWFGIAMLYDTHSGPLFGYGEPGTQTHEHNHDQSAEPQAPVPPTPPQEQSVEPALETPAPQPVTPQTQPAEPHDHGAHEH